jgi:hypothetical protein
MLLEGVFGCSAGMLNVDRFDCADAREAALAIDEREKRSAAALTKERVASRDGDALLAAETASDRLLAPAPTTEGLDDEEQSALTSLILRERFPFSIPREAQT